MQAIKLKATAHDRTLTVQVPQQFNEREVEIFICLDDDKIHNEEVEKNITQKNRIDDMMSIVGTAKYPDFIVSKYDTYNQ